ncbi:MAG: hypothetical protein ACYCYI_12410 [Saccharofermentanales bacterium]
MNRLIIALESLRFYKLKNENTARILFLIVFALILGFYVFPIGTPIDNATLTKIVQGNATISISLISISNIVYYSVQFVIYLITSFLSLIYAASYVMEAEGFPNRKAVISSFRSLPRLIGFLLLLAVPVAISSLLAFLPLIFLFYALFFTPLLIIEGRKGIFKAIAESFRTTHGIRFNIFITQMIIWLLMNILTGIFSAAFINVGYSASIGEFLILSFLRAAYVLISGRLAGNFYLLAVKNEEKLKRIKLGFMNIDDGNISEIDREIINGGESGNSGDDEDSDESDGENDDEDNDKDTGKSEKGEK